MRIRQAVLPATLLAALACGIAPAGAAPLDPPRTICSHTNPNNSVENITINCSAPPGNVIGFSWSSGQGSYYYVVKSGGGTYYKTFSSGSGSKCVSVTAGQTFKLQATNLTQNGFIQAKVAC